MSYLLIAIYLFFTVTGLILIKIGGATFSLGFVEGIFKISVSWKLIVGFLSYVCSFILWTIILQKYNLTYIYPILTSLAFISVLIAGVIVLNEKLTVYNILGALVILVGIVLINIKK